MTHKGARDDLTAEYVRSILDYDPETGVLTWKKCNKYRSERNGQPAGRQTYDGKIGIGINGHRYLAHRLAWLVITGNWPSIEIDHKDGDRSNNRWNNLRLATRSQNQHNTRVRKNNKTGLKGIILIKNGRYRARIEHNGNPEHLGYFDTAEQAYAAYCTRSKELRGAFHNST